MEQKVGYNILIVEDEFLSAQFLEQAIQDLGHSMIANVTNAKDAIAIAKKHKIDLVLMDINLIGEIDGIQCSILINHIQNVPTIYITAFADSQSIAEATTTNLYGYLIKPFSERDIEAALAVATVKLKNKSHQPLVETPKDSIDLGGDYYYNIKKRRLFLEDEENVIVLTKRMDKLLYLLSLHFNHIVPYQKITSFVWEQKSVSNSTLRDAMMRLRKEIPSLNIQTIIGVGYILKSQKEA